MDNYDNGNIGNNIPENKENSTDYEKGIYTEGNEVDKAEANQEKINQIETDQSEANQVQTEQIEANQPESADIVNAAASNPNIAEVVLAKKEKNKSRKGKRILSYVAIGLICAVLGGTAGSAGLMLLMKNSSSFQNTSLYKSLTNQGSGKLYKEGTASSSKATLVSTTGGLSISQIAAKVSPAVVGVSIKSVSTEDEYNYFFNKNNSSSSTDVGFGSGIILNNQGYILTNYHVIESVLGGDEVKIVLNNKKEVSAKVVNFDANNDIAIVKMTGSFTVPGVAELGDSSKLQVGDTAVAIGNPMGKELLGSVTQGIISALNRQITVEGKSVNYIQTDAAINAGNSGGALVNSQGQVIGMNTAKYGGSGVEGLGFAIPINDIKSKINDLINKPMNSQVKLGIECVNIDQDMASQYNSNTIGVGVTSVQSSSSAEKAGIKKGDIIVKFDGKTVKTVDEINSIKVNHKVGDKVKVEVVREGETKDLTLTF